MTSTGTHEPRALWIMGPWTALYTGASVALYVDDVRVMSRQVVSRTEAGGIAATWRESVRVLVELESQVREAETPGGWL